MALITGVLSDLSRSALANSSRNLHPVIEFHPSGPGVRTAASVIYVSRKIPTTPEVSTGAWSVDLELTTIISPEIWYEVVIQWLDEAGNFISVDRLPGRLYVDGPGLFSDKYRPLPNPLQVWVEANVITPPAGSSLGDLVLDSVSGDLSRVS
ncbi:MULTISPECIES: hypothetical protein [unclassified Microbacterium]|uniref:hypothetical protein n=1 Tax=unclassified Microbacterium TaxID=2609290 RepID=UPI0010F62C61|nr:MULTISPECIES: hypothetical protein [unclassified Microbacterium]